LRPVTHNRVSLALVFASGVLAVLAYRTWVSNSKPNASSDATIVYPHEVELGEQEIGALAMSRIKIGNCGTNPLIISSISTNCSCTGLEREGAEGFTRMTQIVVPPLSESEFAVRVSVRGVPINSRSTTRISFETNDPRNPTGLISVIVARVKGGVHAVPEAISVGRVSLGSSVSRTVEIRDDAVNPREIDGVASSAPDRFSVRLVPGSRDTSDRTQEGALLGKLEITLDTSKPVTLNDRVSVRLKGEQRAPDDIMVVGVVAAPIEMFPSDLVLPRRSSNGLVHEATVICRSHSDLPFSLRAQRLPEGVSLECQSSSEHRKQHILTVRVDPKIPKGTYEVDIVTEEESGSKSPLKLSISVSSGGGGR
jgi:hypothetical protein